MGHREQVSCAQHATHEKHFCVGKCVRTVFDGAQLMVVHIVHWNRFQWCFGRKLAHLIHIPEVVVQARDNDTRTDQVLYGLHNAGLEVH
jgi:hypothetical protein